MTLYEQLGGAAGVRLLVDALTSRLEADPEFGPLFAGVDGDGLRRHREQYLGAVLGGPEQYTGRGMREAHRPLRLSDAQFDRFLALVLECAGAVGVALATTDELAHFLRGLRPVMVELPGASASRPPLSAD